MTWTPKMGWRVAVLAIPIALAFTAFSHAQQTTDDSARLREMMDRAERAASIEANKATFVSELLGRFADEAAARGYNTYLSKGTRKLMARSGEDLLRLSEQATDLETFRKLAFEGYTMNTFGQLTQELVFFPMAACRIYDSRAATAAGLIGPMAPGTQRDISVNDSTGIQGGAATDCSTTVPDLNNDPPALAITLTAASPTGPGNLRTFPSGGAVPLAAMLTYTAGTTISTGAITSSCTFCGTELTVRNQGGGNTDVVVDVVGYFHAPFLQAVDCTTITVNSGSIAAGALNNTTATCPAGYTVTGGGFFVSSLLNPAVYTFRSSPSGNAWAAGVVNTQAGTISNDVFARCCRVPGR